VAADALVVGLRQDGHNVFFDRDNLRVAEKIHGPIRDFIAVCDLFIFVISPSSIGASSYALTELALARRRWPNPTGHVLSVTVKPTSSTDIPSYLAGVGYIRGPGNVIAEALAAVERISRDRRRSSIVRICIGATGLFIACGVALKVVFPVLFSDVEPCFLAAHVTKDGNASHSQDELVIDVVYKDATKSFMVFSDGTASLDVGPLVASDASWTFTVRSTLGDSVSRQSIQGCPKSTKTYDLGGGMNVMLSIR